MIIRGGENISPSEIEEFVHHHPKIREVEVYIMVYIMHMRKNTARPLFQL